MTKKKIGWVYIFSFYFVAIMIFYLNENYDNYREIEIPQKQTKRTRRSRADISEPHEAS